MARRVLPTIIGLVCALLAHHFAPTFVVPPAPSTRPWQGRQCRGSPMQDGSGRSAAPVPTRGRVAQHALPDILVGFDLDPLKFGTLAVSIVGLGFGYLQSPEGKKLQAVQKLMQPFKLPKASNVVVERTVMDDIKKRLEKWGKNGKGHTTVIAGLAGSGKSTAMEHVLDGFRGVLWVPVQEPDWKSQMQQQLGVSGVAS